MDAKCGSCGKNEVISIVYGYPAVKDFERSEAGAIALGGCVIRPDAPTKVCRACGAETGRLRDDERYGRSWGEESP